MNLKNCMTCIATNLDDLQSGLEACTRAVDTLDSDAEKLDGLIADPLRRSVARHLKQVRACARDQHRALRQLRESIAHLRKTLQSRKPAVRTAPVVAALIANK